VLKIYVIDKREDEEMSIEFELYYYIKEYRSSRISIYNQSKDGQVSLGIILGEIISTVNLC
jgi:hypothetical protein